MVIPIHLPNSPKTFGNLGVFVWREKERPLSKDDIFLKDTLIKKVIDEGIPSKSDFKDELPTQIPTKNSSEGKEKKESIAYAV